MTDPTLLTRKLALLLEHVSRARKRRAVDREQVRSMIDLQDALG